MPRMKNPANVGSAVLLIMVSAAFSPTLIQAQTTQSTAVVDITLDGRVVSGQAPQPTTVLTGQPINLGFVVFGGSVSSVRWQGSGTAVAGYRPGEAELAVPRANLVNPTLKFYWIDQGKKQVTLLYNLSSGCVKGPANCVRQGNVTATFMVVGPTDVKVPMDDQHPLFQWTKAGFFDGEGGKWAGLGDGASNPGIKFTVSATIPAGVKGQFLWVQVVNSDIIQWRGPSAVCTHASTGGVDSPFPQETYLYGRGAGPIEDSVGGILGSATKYNQMWRQFSANMHLMWKASYKDYIEVPLGYVHWQTGWSLAYNPAAKSDPPWTISNTNRYASPFQLYAYYARWSGPSKIVQTYNSQPGECP